jgi:hypothetical protein
MDSSGTESQSQYKREHSESHIGSSPGGEETRTEEKTKVESSRQSDTDLAPPAESEYKYQYKSTTESRESD